MNLMDKFGFSWVAPPTVEMFMNSYIQGVGVRKEAKYYGEVLRLQAFGVYG